MGVLSDRQIYATPNVVTPLEPGVKREGKISYGVTSYGYDCRVGYVFRVFSPVGYVFRVSSPVGCTVIDPKAFDPAALVTVDLTPVGHDFAWRVISSRDPRYWECVNCGVRYQEKGEGDRLITTGRYRELGPCPAAAQPPDHILIPPNSFALAETVETFDIPRDCVGVVVGKSTYARCGLIVNVTPLEPEWRGKLTVELSNTAPLPIKVYCNEGIFQLMLHRSDEVTSLLVASSSVPVTAFEEMGCGTSYKDKKGKYQDQTGLTTPKVD